MSSYAIEHGEETRDRAKAKLAEARTDADPIAAEAAGRESLRLFATAMNWLEDTDRFEEVHADMHAAGRWVRESFGCQVHQEGKRYANRCPVAVVHKRIGFSPEMLIRAWECSVCGNDPDDCDHVASRMYGEHRCHRIITDAEIIGFAMVTRPAGPEARLLELPIDADDLRRALPSQWKPGMPLSCDQCLLPCSGVEEFEL